MKVFTAAVPNQFVVPTEIEYFVGESGGIGRFNERGAVSQCDPIAERECSLTCLGSFFAPTGQSGTRTESFYSGAM